MSAGRGAARALSLALLVALARPAPANDALTVEPAIQRGARWLLQDTRALGPRVDRLGLGALALRVMALLRSGVPAEQLEPELALLARLPLSGTYEVSLLVLAEEAVGVERVAPGPGELHPVFVPHLARDEERQVMTRATSWLLQRELDGAWGYGRLGERWWDHSNTQFAVYALHAASVQGVEVPPRVFERIARHHLDRLGGLTLPAPARLVHPPGARELAALQGGLLGDLVLTHGSPLAALPGSQPLERQPGDRERQPGDRGAGDEGRTRVRDGAGTRPRAHAGETRVPAGFARRGWSYQAPGSPTLSMTAAGLSSLAMACERLSVLAPALQRGLHPQTLEGLRDGTVGLLWLLRAAHEQATGLNGYDLLALEKGLDAVGVETVGGRSWWEHDARRLLREQTNAGSWSLGYDEGISTAFALLYLNRGTLSPFAREDRKGPVAAAPPPPSPRRPRTGDSGGPAPGAAPAPAAVAPTAAPTALALTPLLAPGGVVLASGAAAAPDQLLGGALATRGKDGDRLLDELRAAWEAMPLLARLDALPALVELARDGARDEAKSWAKRALRELLEGSDPARLETARLLLNEVHRLQEALEAPAPTDWGAADRSQSLATLETALEEPRLPRALRRAVLTALVRARHPGAVPWLLRELRRREPSDRRVGWDLLVALVGEPRPFDPDGSSTARERALKAWDEWWTGPEGQALRGD